MAIYRGIGSAVTTTDQATIDQVSQDASDANVSATNAASSASSASGSATAAASSASAASTSETNAAASETAAAASETAAAASETAAAASETAAAASETAAAASETAAAASETAAAASETAAGTSETNAAASETAAAASATAAAASETAAASSETNAAASETAALAAQAAAEAAQEAIDGLYLGAQTSDPSVDLNGEALTAGDWYYNTTTDVTRIYDGSAWVNGAVSTASFVLAANNLSDLTDAATARTNLGLGTAATTASTDYATAAQGALADSALQDITGESIADLSDVATMTPTDGQLLTWDSGTSKWNAEDAPVSLPDQTGASGYYLTTDGTSASWDALATVANSGAYSDLSGTPTNVSTFTNDSGYLTSYTETDPVVGAISGIVKANGAGTISAAVAGTDYLTPTGDGSGLTGISSDLVNDTTPQLGGDLDTNGNSIDFGASGWSVALSGTDLMFSYGGTNKMKIDSSGNLTVTGTVTAGGTV